MTFFDEAVNEFHRAAAGAADEAVWREGMAHGMAALADSLRSTTAAARNLPQLDCAICGATHADFDSGKCQKCKAAEEAKPTEAEVSDEPSDDELDVLYVREAGRHSNDHSYAQRALWRAGYAKGRSSAARELPCPLPSGRWEDDPRVGVFRRYFPSVDAKDGLLYGFLAELDLHGKRWESVRNQMQANELAAKDRELAGAHDRVVALGYEVADLRQAKDQFSESVDAEHAMNESLMRELAEKDARIRELESAVATLYDLARWAANNAALPSALYQRAQVIPASLRPVEKA